jgi:hypothetical protein
MVENDFTNYKELLNFLLNISNKFSFVIRTNYKITKEEMEILRLFNKYLIYEDNVASWPGTNLLYGKTAHIYYYDFKQESFELLLKISNTLYEWEHPQKPEDLCFYNNADAIFASITHEKYSYFLKKTSARFNSRDTLHLPG